MQVREYWWERPSFNNWMRALTQEKVELADMNDVNAIRLTHRVVKQEIKKGNIILRTYRKE